MESEPWLFLKAGLEPRRSHHKIVQQIRSSVHGQNRHRQVQ